MKRFGPYTSGPLRVNFFHTGREWTVEIRTNQGGGYNPSDWRHLSYTDIYNNMYTWITRVFSDAGADAREICCQLPTPDEVAIELLTGE